MNTNLIISIIQPDLVWENAGANRELFSKKIEAISSETDLIVLPEMFSTGFSMNAKDLAEPPLGESLKWMQKMAAKKNMAITGSLIISENGKYYNRLYFVFPDGTFQHYDKRHTFTLANEHKTYASGTKKLIVEYKGWKICPLVCYDLRFPVWSRNTENYDLLLYVANWPAPRTFAWDTLLKARAIENLCYCIGVNRIGKDGNGLSYLGHSAVYDPLGKQISTHDWEKEFQQEILMERSYLEETRNNLKFLQDRDSFTVK